MALFDCSQLAHVIVLWQIPKHICYCTVIALFYSVFEGNFQVQAPGGLYSEGRFNRGFFALRVWGAYIWRGLCMKRLTFGILRYISCSCLIWRVHVKILWSLYSHYSSAKRNPSNTKSSPLPKGWKWALMQQKQQAAKGSRTTGTFSLKCPSTTSPAAFYLSYVTVCLCAGPS